ncbi:MAG: hypothetical protein GY821_15320 [Gammaproteobacteria bacterium]|nr:hypothetical protein [Gammaproteobacteria bacterium]
MLNSPMKTFLDDLKKGVNNLLSKQLLKINELSPATQKIIDHLRSDIDGNNYFTGQINSYIVDQLNRYNNFRRQNYHFRTATQPPVDKDSENIIKQELARECSPNCVTTIIT